MKSPKIPLQNQSKLQKAILKTLAAKEKRFDGAVKNSKRFRIVQSVRAGHVRGGHSFH